MIILLVFCWFYTLTAKWIQHAWLYYLYFNAIKTSSVCGTEKYSRYIASSMKWKCFQCRGFSHFACSYNVRVNYRNLSFDNHGIFSERFVRRDICFSRLCGHHTISPMHMVGSIGMHEPFAEISYHAALYRTKSLLHVGLQSLGGIYQIELIIEHECSSVHFKCNCKIFFYLRQYADGSLSVAICVFGKWLPFI